MTKSEAPLANGGQRRGALGGFVQNRVGRPVYQGDADEICREFVRLVNDEDMAPRRLLGTCSGRADQEAGLDGARNGPARQARPAHRGGALKWSGLEPMWFVADYRFRGKFQNDRQEGALPEAGATALGRMQRRSRCWQSAFQISRTGEFMPACKGTFPAD